MTCLVVKAEPDCAFSLADKNVPRLFSHFMQIELVLTTRDDLVKQQSELETRVKQQSQEQNDIYQYLRNKLKSNYVAIAELETKVWKRERRVS